MSARARSNAVPNTEPISKHAAHCSVLMFVPLTGYVVTTGARCYAIPSTEPISDCGILMRDSKSQCYSHKMLEYSWSWLPPVYGR